MYHQAETVGEMRRFGQIDGSNMDTRSKLVKSRVVKHQPPEQEDNAERVVIITCDAGRL